MQIYPTLDLTSRERRWSSEFRATCLKINLPGTWSDDCEGIKGAVVPDTFRVEWERKMAGHIALLGDSIFDNAAYTGNEPDVITHLRSLLPSSWRATLCAVDGSRARDLQGQVRKVPSDASHIMVAVGGNDALGEIEMLDLPVRSTAEALELFGERIGRFESAYRDAIRGVISLGPETTVGTIYNGNLETDLAGRARIALMMFNDVILRVAFEFGLKVIDLRLICNEKSDYANPIEPSGQGGRKIAKAIACAAGAIGEMAKQSIVTGALKRIY